MSEVESKASQSRDKLSWRQRLSLGIAATIMFGVGVTASSEGLDDYCNHRNTVAPDGQASSARACEVNDVIREAVERFIGGLIPDIPIPPVFEDKRT